MNEKIAWFEELLTLEPNSKLFFPLAKAYVHDNRLVEAVRVLRNGLTMHPEHLEAKLLLIQCLVNQDQSETAQAEVESLREILTAFPAFWDVWATQSRNAGQDNLALTLGMLSRLLRGNTINWGSVLEKGLRTLSPEDIMPIPEPEPVRRPHPSSTVDQGFASETATIFDLEVAPVGQSTPDLVQASDMPTASADDNLLTNANQVGPTGQEQINDAVDTDTLRSGEVTAQGNGEPEEDSGLEPPVAHQEQWVLSEGERKYYETKTYAELLAKQDENTEALELYTKLLRTSPDDAQRHELQARIHELKERIGKNPTHAGSPRLIDQPAVREVTPQSDQPAQTNTVSEPLGAEAAQRETTPSATIQTLTKLAERLESRARA
jgi:tetratricopeptide (TPR) repeat protein